MVRPEVARTKIARAAAWLDDADEILRPPREEYLADVRRRDLAAFYLFLAVQECIDLAVHWIADAGWAPPDEAGAAFDVLADAGVIDRTLVDALRRATGLRNRIAHGYGRVEHRRIYDEAPKGLAALRRFLDALSRQLPV